MEQQTYDSFQTDEIKTLVESKVQELEDEFLEDSVEQCKRDQRDWRWIGETWYGKWFLFSQVQVSGLNNRFDDDYMEEDLGEHNIEELLEDEESMMP